MRHCPRVFAFMSAPIDTPTLSPFPILPLARSLGGNYIRAKGATALAAVLNETNITNLKCAAAPEGFTFLSAPIDTPQHRPRSHARRLSWNGLGLEEGAALAEALKGNTTLQSLE